MGRIDFSAILAEHPFFKGMHTDYIATLAGCAANARFHAGTVVFHQNDEADRFFVIREGAVAVDISAPGNPPMTIQTLSTGDVLGWSWLFPPYLWNFDARAVEETRAIALDARCLRGKCERDPALGYELMKRFSQIAIQRMQAQRLQLLDMFGAGGGG